MNIKVKEKTIKFKRLTKSLIKEIENQVTHLEDEYGAMSGAFLADDILHFGSTGCIKNNIKYYNPFVSCWDLIKENDDIAIVELEDLNITDEHIADEYAYEMKKYIQYWILDNELNILAQSR